MKALEAFRNNVDVGSKRTLAFECHHQGRNDGRECRCRTCSVEDSHTSPPAPAKWMDRYRFLGPRPPTRTDWMSFSPLACYRAQTIPSLGKSISPQARSALEAAVEVASGRA